MSCCRIGEALFISQLNCLDHVIRCYLEFNSPKTRSHGFSDASELAFAAVINSIYVIIVQRWKSQSIFGYLKMCRSNKEADHTTLELLGAVILSQLMHNVTAFLQTPVSTFYCMDFMATLYWVRTVKAWKQYGAH